ncbi:clarin-3 [Kryptolebias marmoratus]|uniref:Clarin 3 n=1 Tax=Kryptolebias marmoratus TaxID=37003 RepID=A0A3Q3ALK5_KRYMA|nr:clarin-3 [Kryptolebias marmoratus]
MPSMTKTLYFLLSALVTAISVGLLGFAMSRKWSHTTMDCAPIGSDLFNGTAVIKMTLFNGMFHRDSCPSFGSTASFDVFPLMGKTGGTAVVLQVLTVGLLALCLLFSAVSILISLYNSVSNPYQTYLGPVGVYTCSSLSACLSVVVLIIYVLNLGVTNTPEDMVIIGYDVEVELRNKSLDMQVGYFLVIPYTVLSLAAVFMIYMYDHAAYTQRREQERPTEDAPKEIMMY